MGLSADDVFEFFNLPNPSSRIVVLGLTEPLTEMGTRNLSGGKALPEPSVRRLTRQYRGLDMTQPYSPQRPVAGIALFFFNKITDHQFERGNPNASFIFNV
jgi:hypothetical protein